MTSNCSLCAIILLALQIALTISSNITGIELLTQKATLSLYNSQASIKAQNKYCNICCIELQANTIGKKCGVHTMCKYAVNKIGPACKGFIPVGFTQLEKRTMVDAHNTIRSKVATGTVIEGRPGPQPQASNMRALEWNEELALIAQRWAAQCIFGNDICRDLELFPAGQNIARGVLAIDDDLTHVQSWFGERNFFNCNLVDSPASGERSYARYSQLIWADTYLIGCARAIFQANRGARVSYTEHLVCNYGPTGNIPNQRVYRTGAPCSECHEGTACNSDYEGLCAIDQSEDFSEHRMLKSTFNVASSIHTLPNPFLTVGALLWLGI